MIRKIIKSVVLFSLTIVMVIFSPPVIKAAELTEDRVVPAIKCVIPSPGWLLEYHEAATLILKSWEKLGFQLDVKYAPNFVGFVKLVDKPWPIDAFCTGFVSRPDRLEPDKILTEFSAEQIGPRMRNFYGYNNPDYNKVLQASREEMDIEKRRQLVKKAQEYLIRDIPSLAIFHPKFVQPGNKKKWSNMVAGPGLGFFNIFNFTGITPKTRDKNIVIGSVDVMRSLNPMLAPTGNILGFIKFVYDNLAAVASDSSVIPWAAKGWKVKDSRTIDIYLREGMTFHDGKPVTAEDVKFSFDYCRKYTVPEYKTLVEPIQKVEAIDKLNVRLILKKPYAPLFMTTLTTIPIMPKHIWENIVEKEKLSHPSEWANTEAIGSGPFKMVYIRPGEEIALAKNSNHFRAPKADGLTIVFPADREAEFIMVKKATIDFIDSKVLNPVRAKEASQLDHIALTDLDDIGVAWMGFNLREGHLTRDYNIRHALAHTIPRRDIVDNILQGRAQVGSSFIAPANRFWHNFDILHKEVDDKVHFHQYNMEKARKILKDAGFEWDSQGRIYWPKHYKMTVLPSSPEI